MDYVLLAVLVFLSSFLGASLGISLGRSKENKGQNIATKFFDDVTENVVQRHNESEIMEEIDNISEWFHGKAGGTEDDK